MSKWEVGVDAHFTMEVDAKDEDEAIDLAMDAMASLMEEAEARFKISDGPEFGSGPARPFRYHFPPGASTPPDVLDELEKSLDET